MFKDVEIIIGTDPIVFRDVQIISAPTPNIKRPHCSQENHGSTLWKTLGMTEANLQKSQANPKKTSQKQGKP